MCGIVGVAGKVGLTEEKAFSTLLQLDTVRGPHSTGVIVVDNKNEVFHEKTLGTPWDFYKKTVLFGPKGVYFGMCKALIGHNRWATTGGITIKNSHPFDFDNIIGVHNGTLNASRLHNLEDHDKYDVDSQVLFHNIDKYGAEKTIPKTCGAYSLVWWDKQEKTIKFLRNTQRPMWYMFTKDKETVFWASEAWMLQAITTKYSLKTDEILKTIADRLYTIDFENKKKTSGLNYKYLVDSLEGIKAPVTAYRAPGVTYYNPGAYGARGWKYTPPASSRAVNKTLKDNKRINVYYNPDDNKTKNIANISLRECLTEKKVRLVCPQGHYARNLAQHSQPWEYFTVVPNSVTSTYLSKTKETEEGFIAQGNSFQGPFEYEEIKDKKEEEKEIEVFHGFENTMYTKDAMDKKLKNGCSWCGDNQATAETSNVVKWISYQEFVCGSCEGSHFIMSPSEVAH